MALGDPCHERPYIQQVRMGHGGAQTVFFLLEKATLQIPNMGQEQKKHCWLTN